MGVRPILSALVAGALVLALAPSAGAQDEAAAEALFNKGLSEMQAGKWDSACPAFAESQRLDPRPGTLFTLAECEAKAGKLASAVSHYEDYLRVFGRMSSDEKRKQRGRDKVATKAKQDLAPQVPKLTLRLPADAPADARVVRDGVELGRAALGVALPTDPGEHVIVVRLADGRDREQRVTLATGENRELVVELPAATSTDAAPAPVAAPPAPAAKDAGVHRGSNKTVAYVVGGIGLAGLAVGGVTGAMVLGKKGTIQDHCDGTVCDAEGKDAADSAKSLGLVSTIGFGVGIAGVATATVLLLTGGSSNKERAVRSGPTVAAGGHGAFLGWRGAW